jgi:integrase
MDGASCDVTPAAETPRRLYGAGAIEYHKSSGRWRLRFRSKGKSLWFDTEAEAKEMRDAIALTSDVNLGVTLRQWLILWLADHDFGKAVFSTCRALLMNADPSRCPPFIDWPLVSIESGDIAGWAEQLLDTRKTRSVLVDGARKALTLDGYISRAYAKSALSALRSALNAAKNRKPQLITTNPADEVELPSPKAKNGKKRTKKQKRNPSKLDYLTQGDCALLFFCEGCGVSSYDDGGLERLVVCPHVPFFYRVTHSLSRMQALRGGELASQCWERITWRATEDWTGHTWLITTSWDGDTKNGQDRSQALIPMAARLLHRWWEFKGRPRSGLLFDTEDAASKRPLGALAAFVAAHAHHDNAALLRLARLEGLPLAPRRLETLRSEARARTERKRRQAGQMFARGYDFGWADKPYNHKPSGELRVREGWCTKLGLSSRTRLHDSRDTAATHLLSGTWGPRWTMQQVSDFLGHSDIKVTQERYAHITDLARTDAAAAVDPGRLNAPDRRVGPAEIAHKLPTDDLEPSDSNPLKSLSSGTWTRTRDEPVNRSSIAPRLHAVSGKSGQSVGRQHAEPLVAAQRPLETAATSLGLAPAEPAPSPGAPPLRLVTGAS